MIHEINNIRIKTIEELSNARMGISMTNMYVNLVKT